MAGLGAVVLVPALVLTGCGGKKKSDANATTQPTQASSNTQATRPAGSTTAAGTTGTATASNNELVAAGQAIKQIKSFRAAITIEAPGQGKIDGTIEVVQPDKQHLVLTSLGVETIQIGTDLYTKIGPTWQKTPGGASGSTFSLASFNEFANSVAGAGGFQKGGTDTVNGTRCQIYTQTLASGTNEVCVANNLAIRFITNASGSKITIVFSDFDKVGDIKAPI